MSERVKSGGERVTQVTYLTVLLTGLLTGGRASAAPPSPHLIPDEEPPPKTCTAHPDWNGAACQACKSDKAANNAWLTDSRRLLAELEYQRDRATGTESAAAISDQRRRRIAIFQRMGEQWK